MKVCELDRAKREALKLFDNWNDVTGFVEPFSGYYGEITGLIEDAVECGAAYATGNGAEFLMNRCKDAATTPAIEGAEEGKGNP